MFIRERVRNYSIIFLSLGILTFVGFIAAGDPPLLPGGAALLPDFLAHWTGGRLFLDGAWQHLYDPQVQERLQQQELPGVDGLSWFVGPPHSAVLYAPFAALPYIVAAWFWLALTAGLYAYALVMCRPLVRDQLSGEFRLFALAFAATPAVLEVFGSGQDSMVALMILLGGLRLLMVGRDGAAGAVLALGLFKPQLFVFVPIVFLLRRQWRALVSFVGVCALTGLLTVAVFGVNVVHAWLEALSSDTYAHEVQVEQAWKMQSVSALLASVGRWEGIAYVVLLAGVVAACLYLRRSTPDSVRDWAVVITLTIVTSPHVVLYDAVLLMPAAAWAFSTLDMRRLRWPALLYFTIAWTTPLRHAAVGGLSSWPGDLADAPWAAVPLAWFLVRMMREEPVARLTHEAECKT